MAQTKEEKNLKERLRYQQNKEKRLQQTNAWRRQDAAANPEKYKLKSQKRYAKAKKDNPDYWRNSHYKSKYNITLEQWNVMFEEQKGCCFICKKHQSVLDKRLAVDHNANTGEVRKLLCKPCNIAFGEIKEDPEIAKSLLEYALLFKKSEGLA